MRTLFVEDLLAFERIGPRQLVSSLILLTTIEQNLTTPQMQERVADSVWAVHDVGQSFQSDITVASRKAHIPYSGKNPC